jgi:hypothetical protein
MPTINQLPVLSTISSGDQLPVYSPNNGDARRTSIGSLLTFFQQSFASPTLSVNLYVPGSGFNITVPTPVSQNQWMLLQPAGTLATGTITLPLNTGVPDGTTVLITTTQEITSLTIALNGASAIFGAVTSLAATTATVLRFYQPTNSWYQINADAIYGVGIPSFLANPTSANLRAAVTDETGTGVLVFNTSPTLVTPALGTPSALVGTNITGTAAGLTAGNVTTNANLTGAITSVGNAASLGSFTSANLLAALTDETGTGAAVFGTSPTIATPIITNPTVSTGTFTSPALVTPAIGVATGTSLTATGTLVSSGTAGVGYSTGAGGVVTQGTSRTTGVTLNKTTGAITLFSAAGTTVATTFTVTNSTVAATDVIILNQKSGTDLYDLMVTAVAAGSFNLTFRTTGGTTTETPVFNFAVIKGVSA